MPDFVHGPLSSGLSPISFQHEGGLLRVKMLNGTMRGEQLNSMTSDNVYNDQVSRISPDQVTNKWTRARTGFSSSSKNQFRENFADRGVTKKCFSEEKKIAQHFAKEMLFLP